MWTRKMIIDDSFVIGSYYETLSYSNFHIKLNPQDTQHTPQHPQPSINNQECYLLFFRLKQ